VQEAKEIPSVKMIDPPDVPEKKILTPRRLESLLIGMAFSVFTGSF